MNKSESIKQLAISLAKAQSEWPAIGKDTDGYGYKYAPLDKVLAAVRPILAKYDLSFVQMPGSSELIDVVILTSMLIHSSGEFIEETMSIPIPKVGSANAAQCYGAGLTYARRYSVEAMLGIASQEDTDGVADKKKPAQKKKATNGAGPAQKAEPMITEKQRKKLHATGVKLYGDEWDDKRAEMSEAFKTKSSNEWTAKQTAMIIDGMEKRLVERAEDVPLFEDEATAEMYNE